MHWAQRWGTSTPGKGMKTRTLEASGHIQPSCSMLQMSSQRLQPEQFAGSRAIQIGLDILSHRNYFYRATAGNKRLLGSEVPRSEQSNEVKALPQRSLLDVEGESG